MDPNAEPILSMAQTALGAEKGAVTRDSIRAKVELVTKINPTWANVDIEPLIKELETRFNVHVGHATFLQDAKDHISWLPARSGKLTWTYWRRYREYMKGKLAPESLIRLDDSTDEILGLLEDPQREGPWDRRGLVVGHVQSGKTASYTGLICKAADAGFKVIIVLAGIHNNLRAQTQMRLDEGFLGYDSLEKTGIGVGIIPKEAANRPDTLTNRSESGDFSRKVAESSGISPGLKPLLFVVKKQVTVLKNLLAWVKFAAGPQNAHGKHSTDIPLLLIDDEADNASIDTKTQTFDGGTPDAEHEPSKINQQIRKILGTFERSAYVGYTATPFANIFIHNRGTAEQVGDDLFPRSFIINLPTPSNYCGPSRIFGLDTQDYDDSGDLPLVRIVSDFQTDKGQGWMPAKHKSDHQPLRNGKPELPDSVQEAILSFVLSSAVRRCRGHVTDFNSMLIHVTRLTLVQDLVTKQVQTFVSEVRRVLKYGNSNDSVYKRLEELYLTDTKPTSERFKAKEPGLLVPDWEEVRAQLTTVADRLNHVRQINGYAKEVLDYVNHKATGLDVIAIGGDKLARGLTLEGLTVSYFLRASNMYDTLMQMGRWFGYRPGYLDLCRLYTTNDLCEWFEHIARASEELRREFDHMANIGETPEQYGLKVKSHPEMLVTSRVKMKHGTELAISFSQSLSETVVFKPDAASVERNWKLLEGLLPTEQPEKPRERVNLWRDVPAEHVIRFLEAYNTHPDGTNTALIARYIQLQQKNDELTQWTIAVCGGKEEPAPLKWPVPGVRRSKNKRGGDYSVVHERKYSIGRVLSDDEWLDLSDEQKAKALEITIKNHNAKQATKKAPTRPDGISIRQVRAPRRGLLLIYPIVADSEPGFEPQFPLVGLGISLPGSRHAEAMVKYVVNNPYYENQV